MPARSLVQELNDLGDFWPAAVDRLRLLYRDEHEYRVYGVMCPHGKKSARQVDRRDLKTARDAFGHPLFLVEWGKAAVASLPCPCGDWAQALDLGSFIGATPGWLWIVP